MDQQKKQFKYKDIQKDSPIDQELNDDQLEEISGGVRFQITPITGETNIDPKTGKYIPQNKIYQSYMH